VKVLILSHNYPPENSIGGRRSNLLAEYLNRQGYHVSIITLKKTEIKRINENQIEIFDAESYSHKSESNLFIKPLLFLYFNSRKSEFLQKVLGNILFYLLPIDFDIKFHISQDLINKIPKADFVIATGPPWYIIGEGTKLAHTFDAQLIIDYRDSWTQLENSKIKDVNYYGRLGYLKNKKYKIVEKKWLKEASLVTGVSAHILENIEPAKDQIEN
jgi:hypothetical protein